MRDRVDPAPLPAPYRLVAVLAAVAAVIGVYHNSLSVPFLLDDHATITGNPSLTSLWPIWPVLSPPPEVYSAGRPLLNLSFAVNHAIGGTAVSGYHAGNLVIHTLAGLALFGLVRHTLLQPRMSARFGGAATALAGATALVWLVHPVQTASVTYVSQRAESLMALCYLLTLYCFIRGATSGAFHWFVLSVAACAGGMASKEVMITAPVLTLLYDRQFVSGSLRAAWQRHRALYIALASTWLVLVGLMLTSQLGQRGIGVGHSLDRFDYARIECGAVLRYLQLCVWPNPLVFDYGPQLAVPGGAKLAVSALLLAGLLAAALGAFRQSRAVGFTGIAFFILLAPTSSFIPVAGQPIAENRIYLPLAAVVATGVIAGYSLAGRRSLAIAFTALLALGWLTYQRNETFRNEIRLWQDTLAKQPGNVRAWSFLSFAEAAAGRMDEAIATLRAAIKQLPTSAEFHNNAGIFLYQAGRPHEAIVHLREAVRIDPTYLSAYLSLGRLLLETNDFAAAVDCYRASVRLDPRNAEAHNFLGVALVRVGRTAEALEHFRTAVNLRPDFAEARTNLAAMGGLSK